MGFERNPDGVSKVQRRLPVEVEKAATVVGYSNIDPLSVPKELIDAIYLFDGRPTSEALQAIEAKHGLGLSPGALRKLVDFGILFVP